MVPEEKVEKSTEELVVEGANKKSQTDVATGGALINASDAGTVTGVAGSAALETSTQNISGGKALVSVDGRRKRRISVVVGMLSLALISVGGVSFGIWVMIDRDAEIEDLNNQIVELKAQMDDLQDQRDDYEEERSVVDSEVSSDTVAPSTINSAEYIYVGEWGVKFKIPENLEWVGYDFRVGMDGLVDHSLCVSGATSGHDEKAPNFVNNNNMICMNRKKERQEYGPFSWQSETPIDGYYYIANGQQVIQDGVDIDWYGESASVIMEMLTDNMSAIYEAK